MGKRLAPARRPSSGSGVDLRNAHDRVRSLTVSPAGDAGCPDVRRPGHSVTQLAAVARPGVAHCSRGRRGRVVCLHLVARDRFQGPRANSTAAHVTVLTEPGAPPVRAVLFDLDGTLYFQRPLRMVMACEMGLAHAAALLSRRPSEVPVILTFRRMREDLRSAAAKEAPLAVQQYTAVAKRLGCSTI